MSTNKKKTTKNKRPVESAPVKSPKKDAPLAEEELDQVSGGVKSWGLVVGTYAKGPGETGAN